MDSRDLLNKITDKRRKVLLMLFKLEITIKPDSLNFI